MRYLPYVLGKCICRRSGAEEWPRIDQASIRSSRGEKFKGGTRVRFGVLLETAPDMRDERFHVDSSMILWS